MASSAVARHNPVMDELAIVIAVVSVLGLFVVALVGLIVAIHLGGRVDALRRRLDRLEASRAPSRASADRASPPSEPQTLAALQAIRRDTPPSASAPRPAEAEPETPAPAKPAPTPPAAAPVTSAPLAPVPVAAQPDAGDKPASLEEKLGARLFVWIGGIALLLAGAFLVKFSFDQGLLSPGVRLSLGALFGIAMMVGAEFMRGRSTRIAQALCGAGVADLYACLLGATSLYHLLSPTIGFVLMVIVTGGAVVLALRHGPFVAVLGLVGGFVTPALIGATAAPGPLFTYLILLEVAMVVVTRRRGWSWLSLLTLMGGFSWALVEGVLHYGVTGPGWLGGFVLATAAVFVFSAFRAGADGEPKAGGLSPFRLAGAAVSIALALMALFVIRGGFTPIEFGFIGALGLGVMILARIDARYRAMPFLTFAATAALLFAAGYREDWSPERFAWLCAGFVGLYVLLGYGLMWGSGAAGAWAGLVSVAAVVFGLVLRWGLRDALPGDWQDGLIAAVAAGVLGLMSIPLWFGSKRDDALHALLLGTIGAMTLSLGQALDAYWLPTGWAALGVVASAVLVGRRLPGMVWAVAWCGGVAITALIAPGPFARDIGDGLIFNALLPQYGLPVVALLAVAWLTRRAAVECAAVNRGVAAGLFFLLISLLIRHGFHPVSLGVDTSSAYLDEWIDSFDDVGLWEAATYAAAWLVFAVALLGHGRFWGDRVIFGTGGLVALLGTVVAVVGAGVLLNPLVNLEPVGVMPVFNGLLYCYGVPVALGVALIYLLRRSELQPLAYLIGITSLLLLFGLISLEVRQFFHGSILSEGNVSHAEWYAYSLAWILFAGLLLVLGIVLGSTTLRYASLVVMLLSVGKVFIFDTAHLRDLYRVVSFLGLGVALLVLGYLYQRFVFKRPERPAAPSSA